MKIKNLLIIFLVGLVLFSSLISFVSAVDISLERQNRLAFDHILFISNLSTLPDNVIPGQNFILKFRVTNEGSQFAKDIVAKVTLPSEITTFKDVGTVKIAQLDAGDFINMDFNLVVKPDTTEGIYNLPITITYINYIGDERTENETIGIAIGSIPDPIVEIKTSDIYDGNNIGKITVEVINNNLANIKFLTVNLLQSGDFEKLNSDVAYIGDLSSDDTQSVDFRIKVDSDKDLVSIPILLTFKDSLNRDYSIEKNMTLKIVSAKEAGIKKNYSGWIFLIVIIAVGVGYYFYRQKKQKEQQLKAKAFFNKK